MKNQIDLTIKVEATAGADIPSQIIPQMVTLANKMGICVEATLNTVQTFALPGDEPFDLAIAWRRAIHSKNKHPLAFAQQGKEFMEKP